MKQQRLSRTQKDHYIHKKEVERDYIPKEFVKNNQTWTGKAILEMWEGKRG